MTTALTDIIDRKYKIPFIQIFCILHFLYYFIHQSIMIFHQVNGKDDKNNTTVRVFEIKYAIFFLLISHFSFLISHFSVLSLTQRFISSCIVRKHNGVWCSWHFCSDSSINHEKYAIYIVRQNLDASLYVITGLDITYQ